MSGCTALIPVIADAASSGAGALVGSSASSSSDADSVSYTLQNSTTPDEFIHNVKASAKDLGFEVQYISPVVSTAPTMVNLSKQSSGVFKHSFTSVNIALHIDNRTVSINSNVHGEKAGIADTTINGFKENLDGKYKALVTRD